MSVKKIDIEITSCRMLSERRVNLVIKEIFTIVQTTNRSSVMLHLSAMISDKLTVYRSLIYSVQTNSETRNKEQYHNSSVGPR